MGNTEIIILVCLKINKNENHVLEVFSFRRVLIASSSSPPRARLHTLNQLPTYVAITKIYNKIEMRILWYVCVPDHLVRHRHSIGPTLQLLKKNCSFHMPIVCM